MNCAVKPLRANRLTDTLRLATLGRLELRRGEEVLLGGRRKLLTLLAYLARFQVGRPILRIELASRFWSDTDEPRARASLRQALTELREALGPALAVTDSSVCLQRGSIEVDADQFERAMAEGEVEAAVAWWQGDFLVGAELTLAPGLRDWLEGEREQLRRARARAGVSLVAAAEARGDWEQALGHARAWVEALPDDPEAGTRLRAMRLLVEGRDHPLPSAGGVGLQSPDLIGREADFAILTGAWDTVERGGHGLTLIEGEEGTGRTRLLEEWVRWVERRAPRTVILRGRAFASEADRPLLLARHLLVPLAQAAGIAATPPAALRALQRVAPEFGEYFPNLPAGPADSLPEAVMRALAEVAGEHRVVLVVDDVHHADPPSRQLLEALLRRPIAGVMIVLTATPGVLPLAELEGRGPGTGPVYRIRLGPLDRDDLERMLASMGEFAREDRAALADRLSRETEGNPRAVVELTLALADEGRVALDDAGRWRVSLPPPGEPLPLPASLRESMAARVDRLDPVAQRLLGIIAVLGRQADITTVLALVDGDHPAAESALDLLLAKRWVRLVGTPPVRLEFPREAVARAVYDALPPLTRRELHQSAAGMLERRPARNSAAVEAIAHHRRLGGGRRSLPRWGPAVALLTIGVLGMLLWRTLPRPAEPRRIAVGAVVAESAGAAIRPVLPALLALALEGQPDVKVVGTPGADSSDLMSGAATHLLTGTIRMSGDQVILTAVLRGRAGSVRPAQAAGSIEELGALGSALAEGLAGPGARPGARRFALEAARTRSLEALESYLRGLRLSAAQDIEGAAQAFWRATRSDTTFALAWHALARVNAYFWLGDRAVRMADIAVARAGRLSPRDLQVLRGWRAFAHGDAVEAERQFRAVLAFAPQLAEAHVGLAEVLHHHNWSRGRDLFEAVAEWETAARLDPSDWRPQFHRFELALRQRRAAAASALLSSAETAGGDTSSLADERLLLTLASGDSTGLAARLRAIGTEGEWTLALVGTNLAVLVDAPHEAEEVARILTDPRRSPEIRAYGHESVAHLALASGRWREAQRQIQLAAALEPVSAASHGAMLWAAPFLPSSLSGDSGRRAAVMALRPVPRHEVKRTLVFWFDYDRTREWLLRPYLSALLSATPDTLLVPDPGAPFPDSLVGLAPRLRASLAGWAAARRGDSLAAITALTTAWDSVDICALNFSPASGRPWDLYLLAEGLAAVGRTEEAVRWFGGLGTNGLVDYAYVAPAALRRGELLEELGRPTEAVLEYRRFLRLWPDPDPEFRPLVDSARARLASLSGAPS